MINRVLIVGRLTRDPELRHTAGGTAVLEMSVAVNSREKDSGTGEWGDRVDYFDVTVWENQAESCAQYLAKGSQVAIDGRLRQERWKTKDTDENRSKVKIVASTVQFLDSRERDDSVGDGPDDDFPF